MTSNTALAALGTVSTVYLLLIIITILVKWRSNAHSPCILMTTIAVFVWQVFYTLFYIVPDINAAFRLHELKYIGICFLPALFLLTVFKTTGRGERCTARNALCFMAIPALLLAMVLTNEHHWLFRTDYTILESPFRQINSEMGPLYYMMLIYGEGVLAYVLFYSALSYKRVPLSCLTRLSNIIAAAIIPLIIAILDATNLVSVNYEILLLATLVSLTLLIRIEYFAPRSEHVFTRDLIFEGYANPLFILDEDENIIDMNTNAAGLMPAGREVCRPGVSMAFADWLRDWSGANSYTVEYRDGDIFLSGESDTMKIRKIDILGGDGRRAGTYVELMDNTRERNLLKQLEYLATIDPLTGLNNRAMYESELTRDRAEGDYPLGVFMFDINGLKDVNDSFGHKSGDKLITDIARIISANLPRNCFIARVGGDEFVAILPRATQDVMDDCTEDICSDVEKSRNMSEWKYSLSIGATLCAAGEPINEAVSRADKHMYIMKKCYYETSTHNRRGGYGGSGMA